MGTLPYCADLLRYYVRCSANRHPYCYSELRIRLTASRIDLIKSRFLRTAINSGHEAHRDFLGCFRSDINPHRHKYPLQICPIESFLFQQIKQGLRFLRDSLRSRHIWPKS